MFLVFSDVAHELQNMSFTEQYTVQWTMVYLEPPNTLCNRWTVQGLQLSKLPVQNIYDAGNAVDLFMRKEAWDLWHTLETLRDQTDSNRTTLWLSGPPGVGKSTLLFGWARYVTTKLVKLLAWVHCVGDIWYVTKI
jgi:hypothetical protein